MEQRRPRPGEHVLFDDGLRRRDALVTVVMVEPAPPTVALILIRPGGDTMIRSRIPHASRAATGQPRYLFPDESPAK